jgi:hypothetical protein
VPQSGWSLDGFRPAQRINSYDQLIELMDQLNSEMVLGRTPVEF